MAAEWLDPADVVAWLTSKRDALGGRLARTRLTEGEREDRRRMLDAMIGEVEAGLVAGAGMVPPVEEGADG